MKNVIILISLILIFVSCSKEDKTYEYWDKAFIKKSLIAEGLKVTKDYPIRSIMIESDTKIKVMIGDYGNLSGGGNKVVMKLINSQWLIESNTSFDA